MKKEEEIEILRALCTILPALIRKDNNEICFFLL